MGIDIKELTLGQIEQLRTILGGQPVATPPHPYQVGKNYQIRTVTMIYTGKLVSVGENELELEKAAWIPDTGRFQNATESGKYNEVEMYPQTERVIIGRGAIVDAVVLVSDLPSSQK